MIGSNPAERKAEKTIQMNATYAPFQVQWLDSSYQQTCLPDSPWQQILDDLEPALSNRVRQQFNNPQRRQILIELLGAQFQRQFIHFDQNPPHSLIASTLSEEQQRKLENEAKSWLQIQTLKAASEIGAARREGATTDPLSDNTVKFLAYTNRVLWKSLERYLYQVQQKEIIRQEERRLDEINKIKHKNERTGGSQLRSILRETRTHSRKLPIINESPSSSHSMTSQYSDILSDSIIALLKQDLRRITFLKEKLFGQQLPMALRQISWAECLFRFEKKPFESDLSFVELQTRRNFASGITRGKNELKLSNPSNTPIKNLIENDVIETYSTAHALQPYLEEHHLRFTIKIVNVLYTYKKIYEPYLICALLPFQLAYADEAHKDEGIYVLAMHLDLFLRHCFPKWSTVFVIGSKIMSDMSINDLEFYTHLKKIAKINATVDLKNFAAEIIALDGSTQSNTVKQYEQELMTDPAIFLRKWICQMFVGVLNSNCLLYLWDQLFMTQWETIYIEHACRAILYLLRDNFLCAEDYEAMRKVFLDEPCRLYTSDVQTAFVHLALKQGDPKYLPTMNQRMRSMKPLENIRSLSIKQSRYVQPIGVKNITLSFITPVTKDPRQEFQYKSVVVKMEAYSAGEKLGSIKTTSIATMEKREQLRAGWEKLTVAIVDESLILPIQQAHQSFMPTRIQALVTVSRRTDLDTAEVLGHCRFPLYIPQKVGHLDTWDVTFGPVQRALHSGVPPSPIDMIPDLPTTFTSGSDHKTAITTTRTARKRISV